MDALSIAKTITRAVLVTLVLAVVAFSLLLAPQLDAAQILFALAKGALTFLFGWIFILILSDTMVKSIASSAMESRASRRDGGFIYHFLKPEPGEITDEGVPAGKKRPATAEAKE